MPAALALRRLASRRSSRTSHAQPQWIETQSPGDEVVDEAPALEGPQHPLGPRLAQGQLPVHHRPAAGGRPATLAPSTSLTWPQLIRQLSMAAIPTESDSRWR